MSAGLSSRNMGLPPVSLFQAFIPHVNTLFEALGVFFQFRSDLANLRHVGDWLIGIADEPDGNGQQSEFLFVALAVFGHDISLPVVFRRIKRRHFCIELLDDPFADFIRHRVVDDKDQVVPADVADKTVLPAPFAYHLDQYPREFFDNLVTFFKTVFVIIGLELVQVGVPDGEYFL